MTNLSEDAGYSNLEIDNAARVKFVSLSITLTHVQFYRFKFKDYVVENHVDWNIVP